MGAPVHLAATKNHATALAFLAQCGVDLNVQTNNKGRTPAHLAAEYEYKESLEVLLQNGADFNVQDKRGDTPMDTLTDGRDVDPETAQWLAAMGFAVPQ